MKKIFVSMLAFVFLMNTLVLATDINVDFDLRTVNVSVSDTLGVENPTMQLFNADKTQMLYADEGSKNEDGSYSFDSFKMKDDAKSGDYIIRIGENGKKTEKTVYYPSKAEMIEMINYVKSDSLNATELVAKYHRILGIESTLLENIGSQWEEKIETELKKLSLGSIEDEAIINGRKDIKDTLVLWKDIVTVFTVKEKTSFDKVIAKIGGFDLTHYTKLTDFSHISKAMNAVEVDINALTVSDILDLFDGAVLTGVIIQNDWETAKNILKYYVNKNLISIDDKYLNAGASVFKQFREKGIIDYTKIPGELVKCYNSNQQSGGPGGGSGGGSGSSGDKGGNIIAPDRTTITSMPNDVAEEVSNHQSSTASMFNDISAFPWAQEAIIELAKMGAINGKSEKTYAPEDHITRAEFVKIIVQTFKLNDASATVDFNDVNKDNWYYGSVASASKHGLINGIDENTFGATANISREDMAVIASRLIDVLKINKTKSDITFADKNDIADYAVEAVEILSGIGVINGMGDGTFSPKTNVTRAQGAKVIYELLKMSRGAK